MSSSHIAGVDCIHAAAYAHSARHCESTSIGRTGSGACCDVHTCSTKNHIAQTVLSHKSQCGSCYDQGGICTGCAVETGDNIFSSIVTGLYLNLITTTCQCHHGECARSNGFDVQTVSIQTASKPTVASNANATLHNQSTRQGAGRLCSCQNTECVGQCSRRSRIGAVLHCVVAHSQCTWNGETAVGVYTGHPTASAAD